MMGQFGDQRNICSKADDKDKGFKWKQSVQNKIPTLPPPLINCLRNANLIWAPKEKIKTRN